MPIDGLTDQQSKFIKKYLVKLGIFNRKRDKAFNEALIAEYKDLIDRIRDREVKVSKIDSAVLKAAMQSRLENAENIIGRNKDYPDIPSAHAEVDKVDAMLLFNRRATRFKDRQDALAKKLPNAKKLLRQNADELQRLWDDAERTADVATVRIDEGLMLRALHSLDAIETMIRSAVAEQKLAEQLISDPTGGEGVAATLAVSAAKSTFDVEVASYRTLLQRLTDTFKPTLPPALSAITTVIDAAINGVDKADPAALTQATTQIKQKIAELEQAAKAPIADRKRWLEDLAAVDARLKTLKNHTEVDEPNHVKPKVELIQGDLTLATRKASEHKYAGASQQIDGLVDACNDTIKLADSWKKLNAIREDRETRIAELNALAASTHATVTTTITEAKAKMQEAKDAYTAVPMDVITACKAYDDVAPMIDEAKRLHRLGGISTRAGEVLNEKYQEFKDWQDGLNPADTPLEPDLGIVKASIDEIAALFAVTNESKGNRGQALEKGIAKALGALRLFGNGMEARKNNATAYYDARTAHKTRLEKFEGKPGEDAVREFISRMKTDARQAEGAVGKKAYHVGAQILESSDKDEEAMLKQLEFGAAFFPKYKEVETLINAIIGKENTEDPSASIPADPNKDKAASLIADAQTLRGEAYGKGVSQRDWGTANTLIDAAKARVVEASKMLAALKSVETESGKLGESPAVALQAMRQAAAAYADGAFADKLAKADEAIARATASGAEASTVTTNAAEAKKVCEDIIALAGKKKAYDTAHQAVTQKFESDVKPKDTPENGISEQRQKIEQLIKDAEELAKPGVENFDGAQSKLSEAMSLVNAVPAMLAQRAALAAKMQKVTDQITKMKGPDYLAGCGKEIDQLEKIKAAYDEAAKTFDLGKMKALAEQGEALVAPLDVVAERYKDFNAKGYVPWMKTRYEAIAALSPDLSDAEFKERARVHDLYTSFKHEVARHSYAAAMKSTNALAWTAKVAEGIAANWDAYKPVKQDTRELLDAVRDELVDSDTVTSAEFAKLEERHTAALAWEKERFDFVRAKKMMEELQPNLRACSSSTREFKAYKEKLDALDEELAKLQSQNSQGAVTAVISRLQGKRTNAEKMATDGNRVAGTALLKAAIDEATAALADAGKINGYCDATSKIGTDAAEETADLAALCDKAKTQIGALVKSMDGVALMPQALAMGDRIAEAKAGLPGETNAARTALTEVSAELVTLRQEIGQIGQILREVKAAEDLIAPLIAGHEQAAYSAPEAQDLQDKLSNARQMLRSDSSRKAEAMQSLEEAMTAYHPLKAAADAHVDYVALRDQVAPLIEPMEKHENRYAIQDDMVSFRTKIVEAEESANAKDHTKATALLNEAKSLQAAAMLKAKMVGHGKPTADEVKAILDGPNGEKELDKIVESLDPSATREVLRVALTVRFGCTLEMIKTEETRDKTGAITTPFEADLDHDASGEARKGPNMMALYKAMSLLPPADTLSNESLGGVVRVAKSSSASDHHPMTKKMTMREGEASDSFSYGIGLEYELEGVPPELQPKPGKPVRQFNWNTLHEVGHAVDDKLNFTTRRGKELGGWHYAERDVGPYAEVIAKKFKYDKDYVARLMLKETDPPVPSNPDPSKIEPDAWERRRIQVKAWLENTFEGRQPWQTTSAAKACEIDGRCYHESMSGYWVSYPIAERSKGVTGYQFRSPLEWFSELYAAYHTDRLADTHPAREWLDKLKNPEEV